MNIKYMIIFGYIIGMSPYTYSMQLPQCATGFGTDARVDEFPYLFGRALLKLVHGVQEEFNAQLRTLAQALQKYPNIDLDAQCMVCNHKGGMTSMRTYYKAMKRTVPSSHAFASLTAQEREILGKTRYAALEKVFTDAGKPL